MSDLGVLIPVAAILAWPITSVAKSFATRRAGAEAPDLARLDARLARVEQAVDAIAIEVERVAEGQRFTAACLAERPAVPLAPGADGVGRPTVP